MYNMQAFLSFLTAIFLSICVLWSIILGASYVLLHHARYSMLANGISVAALAPFAFGLLIFAYELILVEKK